MRPPWPRLRGIGRGSSRGEGKSNHRPPSSSPTASGARIVSSARAMKHPGDGRWHAERSCIASVTSPGPGKQWVVEHLRETLAPDVLPSQAAYARILVTTPAPTVLPLLRIAKRICSSSATGETSSIDIVMVSPGITIFTSSGKLTLPVTSVVRR